MSIKILLADDHQIIREGLRNMLEEQPNLKVIGEAENGATAVRKAKNLNPDVIVMDIGMPDLNGIEATRQIIAEIPHVKIVALSMHAEQRFIAEMLKAGASAYLLKDSAFEELVQAIYASISNKFYLSPSIAEKVIKDYINHIPAGKFLPLLYPYPKGTRSTPIYS